jgi:hypothetical protein
LVHVCVDDCTGLAYPCSAAADADNADAFSSRLQAISDAAIALSAAVRKQH